MMRDLDECLAEVFRRSEKRIRMRRQRRNRMLMACTPLVLCITLFSVFVLPAMMPAGSEDTGAADGAVGALTEAKHESLSLSCAIAKITVSGPGVFRSYTDASEVLPIFYRLNSCLSPEPQSNAATGTEVYGDNFQDIPDKEEATESTACPASEGYTVTLVAHNGKTTEYLLTGSALEDPAANRVYALSKHQAKELGELLGIPAP